MQVKYLTKQLKTRESFLLGDTVSRAFFNVLVLLIGNYIALCLFPFIISVKMPICIFRILRMFEVQQQCSKSETVKMGLLMKNGFPVH